MPPKKGEKGKGKKGKGGEAEVLEPLANPAWEMTIENGVWSAPVEELPDPSMWPTWGALRERVLGATRELSVTGSEAADDDFAAELVKLSPTNLTSLSIMNCPRLTRFALSPTTSCPSVKHIDLSNSAGLEEVLIQANNVERIILNNCAMLRKVILQAKGLSRIEVQGCSKLTSVAIWADALTSLDMSDCLSLVSVDLYCPNLAEENLYREKSIKEERESDRHISILESIPQRIAHRF